AITETARLRYGGSARNWRMNFNLISRKSVQQKLIAHKPRCHEHGIEPPIQFQLPTLLRITRPLYRQRPGVCASEKRATRHEAIRRKSALANFASEIVVFVAAQAIELMIVNH